MFLSYPEIPMEGSSKLPVVLYFSIIGLTTFIGTANPIPSAVSIFSEFIPITSPAVFINGPPLFPGFIVASVCH